MPPPRPEKQEGKSGACSRSSIEKKVAAPQSKRQASPWLHWCWPRSSAWGDRVCAVARAGAGGSPGGALAFRRGGVATGNPTRARLAGHPLALLDVFFVATLVVWFGHGGLVAAFFIAVLPYSFEQTRGVGEFLVVMASLAYIASAWLHGRLYGGAGGLDDQTLMETFTF